MKIENTCHISLLYLMVNFFSYLYFKDLHKYKFINSNTLTDLKKYSSGAVGSIDPIM
ncbi:hypothetical protein RhiirC2_800929 [Rhizophagus irregularis]|uniref:Uncharacterized protein n=1 Tax=Rhizophagus irregularis TaxID=588596 RepID=A0A2N1M310_9GLOM|nr:hypothetical protein RhiirC2_800929 [Rhizophagus irregularis]